MVNKRNPAQRRYLIRLMPLMVSYAIILIGVNAAQRGVSISGATLGVMSVLPAIRLVGVMIVMGMYLCEERDEFVRNRLVMAMLGGTGILLAATTVWGSLENHGVVGHPPTFLAFPFWCGAMGISQCAMALHDRFTSPAE
ncbi:hypothetical protein [Sphingomonas sp. Leaf62]|uniref:hypothetical protein n=1 Tax=Sphingomonas sp. Leaf62 TaxID=1736228 RepID=UPI0006F7E313|nr:hypothetical protein [Sphingomonas sp. Leaf62]KQN76577.1 hypothetical protein ASE91_01000 [Sphingomonas sp. Leaf62]